MDAVSKLKVLFEADSSALDKAFGDVDKKAGGLAGMFGKATGAIVRWNLSVAKAGVLSTARAISTVGSATVQASMTVDRNHAYGYTQAVEAGITHTNTVTTDPQVSAGRLPLPGSPLLTNGPATYRRDKDCRQARRFIGAFCAATMLAALSGPAAALEALTDGNGETLTDGNGSALAEG